MAVALLCVVYVTVFAEKVRIKKEKILALSSSYFLKEADKRKLFSRGMGPVLLHIPPTHPTIKSKENHAFVLSQEFPPLHSLIAH